MITIPLSHPVTLPDGPLLKEIELREPTVDDVVKHGYPTVFGYDGAHVIVVPQPKAIMGYIAELSGYPPSTFKKISMTDLAKLTAAVQSFFPNDNPETSSS